MRISDWSPDVCSSDLARRQPGAHQGAVEHGAAEVGAGDLGARQVGAAQVGAAQPCVIEIGAGQEIGRASCRERVWQYVEFAVGAISLTKNKIRSTYIYNNLTIKSTTNSIQQHN